MRKYLALCLVILSVSLLVGTIAWAETDLEKVAEKIHWLGQATIKIEAGENLIYIDPYQIEQAEIADVILITHGHEDHFSLNDIAKLVNKETIFVAPEDVANTLQKKYQNTIITLRPGGMEKVNGIPIQAVPAYNVKKTSFHPKDYNWVGYILSIDNVRIYHAGDTERIPEMKTFTCDIALLPLGQTYTMNSVQEAADAALDVQAKIAIPIHYALYEGKEEDAAEFSKLLEGKIIVMVKPNE